MDQFRQHVYIRFAAPVPHPAPGTGQTAGQKQGQPFTGSFSQQHLVQFRFHPLQGKIMTLTDIESIAFFQIIFCTRLSKPSCTRFRSGTAGVLHTGIPLPLRLRKVFPLKSGKLGIRPHGFHVTRHRLSRFLHSSPQVLFYGQPVIIITGNICCRVITFHISKI